MKNEEIKNPNIDKQKPNESSTEIKSDEETQDEVIDRIRLEKELLEDFREKIAEQQGENYQREIPINNKNK